VGSWLHLDSALNEQAAPTACVDGCVHADSDNGERGYETHQQDNDQKTITPLSFVGHFSPLALMAAAQASTATAASGPFKAHAQSVTI
jgi:hypothetical protein